MFISITEHLRLKLGLLGHVILAWRRSSNGYKADRESPPGSWCHYRMVGCDTVGSYTGKRLDRDSFTRTASISSRALVIPLS